MTMTTRFLLDEIITGSESSGGAWRGRGRRHRPFPSPGEVTGILDHLVTARARAEAHVGPV